MLPIYFSAWSANHQPHVALSINYSWVELKCIPSITPICFKSLLPCRAAVAMLDSVLVYFPVAVITKITPEHKQLNAKGFFNSGFKVRAVIGMYASAQVSFSISCGPGSQPGNGGFRDGWVSHLSVSCQDDPPTHVCPESCLSSDSTVCQVNSKH